MHGKSGFPKVLGVACLLIWWAMPARAAASADPITIRVHLFHAALPEGRPGLGQTEVLTTASRPELAALEDKAGASEAELTAALIDALLDIYDLDAVNDLYLIEKAWNGLGRPDLEEFVFGSLGPFRIKLKPRMLSPGRLSLGLDISKASARTPDSGKLEVVVQTELTLTIGDPIIVSAPANDGRYFAMVTASTGNPAAPRPGPGDAKGTQLELVPAPKPIKRVEPSYPEELRRRGIGGEVGLEISIDMKGNVTKVDVIKPIHAYLNFTAVQAFRQWTFEPVLRKGKPRAAAFRCGYGFDPASYAPVPRPEAEPPLGPDPARRDELSIVLERCGQYCRTLAGAALDFVCQETIKETRYSLLRDLKWAYLAVGPSGVLVGATRYIDKSSYVRPSDQLQFQDAAHDGSASDLVEDRGQFKPKITPFQVMDPKQTQKNSYVCDYQIVRKAGKAEERRVLLKRNGRTVGEGAKELDEKWFSEIGALFAPLRVIAPDRQSRFDYGLIGDDKVRGNRAYVVRALPKSGDEDGIWSARIWIDTKTYQVLKCEIEGVPIEGYEDVLSDCARLNIRPSFVVTHEYGAEKKGVLFPERSTVRVGYPGIDPQGKIPKIVATLTYAKYKYFTVETENAVIK
jgi:TonB family protein